MYRPDGLKHASPQRASAFLGLVRAGETLVRDLDADLERDHGISLRAHEVLLVLALFAPGGRLRMAELNGRTPLSQSRVSRLVAELEARGLVKRSPADGDDRAVEDRHEERHAHQRQRPPAVWVELSRLRILRGHLHAQA